MVYALPPLRWCRRTTAAITDRPSLMRRRTLALFVSLILALVGSHAARAEETKTSDGTDPNAALTAEIVQTRLKRVEESSDIDAELKPKLIDLYKQSLESLKSADEWSATAAGWQSRRKEQDPEELKKNKARLEHPEPEPTEVAAQHAPLTELEQAVAEAEADLNNKQRQLAEADPKRRREQLPQLIVKAQEQLKSADDELSKLPPASDTIDLPGATRTRWSALKRAVQAELTAYDTERAWYDANTALLASRQDVKALEVRLAEAKVKRYRDLLTERRRQAALKQAEEARRAALNAKLPQLKVLADHNAELTQEQSGPNGFLAKNAAIVKEADELSKLKAKLNTKFEQVQKRIDAAGLTDAVGFVLLKQQSELPDLGEHRQRLRQAKSDEAHLRAKLIELEDQRADLGDLDSEVARRMNTVEHTTPQAERNEIEQALRELLKAQQEYLDSQIQAGNDYFDNLTVDFISVEAGLINQIEEYKAYIGERILWVRSAPVIAVSDATRAWDGLVALVDVRNCLDIAGELAADARRNPGIYLAAGLVLIPLFIGRRRLRRKIDTIDRQTAQNYTAEIGPTIKVAILTAMISVIWPALLALLALRLSAAATASLHAQAIAYGLRITALAFLSLEFVRQICRHRGLAESHFSWPHECLELVRRHIRWAMLLGLPLCFVVAVVEAPEYDLHRSPLGRIAFIASLVVIAAFAHCVVHPTRGILHNLTTRKDVNWFWRSPRIWHFLAIGCPLGLAAVAALGYFYTALILAWRLHATMWLLLGLMIAQAFAQRCLLIARRKLAIKQARERRAAALQMQQASTGAAPEAGAAPAAPPMDLVTIDVQTRRLLRSSINVALAIGCWLIWIDVLPALGIFDRYEITSYMTEKFKSINGELKPVPTLEHVTLGDALLSGVVVIMTIIASRNLPGLLEIAFLQRLPIDPGGRYAISTVSRYVITLVGVVFAFWMIGIGWSNIQWLVAAMTVGLGFGLQEIFANFISGLIILFERPVRVGDVVTIGEKTGAVTRIRIRATTITDGDRKELIVPNKEFITGQLVNWTLSDRVLRMVIRIGVAYGSDVTLARQLLMKAAEEDARVLRDPPATAFFEEFADSTLNFELRVFFEGLENFVDLRHDLNSRINELYREAGIEMAFPQCDIHVRSVDAIANTLPVRVEPLKRAS